MFSFLLIGNDGNGFEGHLCFSICCANGCLKEDVEFPLLEVRTKKMTYCVVTLHYLLLGVLVLEKMLVSFPSLGESFSSRIS